MCPIECIRINVRMRNYKPIKYFIDQGLTNLSQKQIRRNAIEALVNNDEAIRLVKNSRNRDQYEIDLEECEHIIKRKNNTRKILNFENPRPSYISLKSDYKNDFYNKGAHLFGKKKCMNSYNVEATINLKLFRSGGSIIDNIYGKEVYEFLVERFKESINSFFYQIEIDSSLNYHLHMGITGNLEEVKQIIFNIVYKYLGEFGNTSYHKLDFEKQYAIKVQNMVDQELYINYISKDSDGLGGCQPKFYFG